MNVDSVSEIQLATQTGYSSKTSRHQEKITFRLLYMPMRAYAVHRIASQTEQFQLYPVRLVSALRHIFFAQIFFHFQNLLPKGNIR
jgi:hypothetical protein